MNPIEDRLRASLRERAEDVEATPQLWAEVDRRVARRRRWTVSSWVAATAAAAIAAVVVAPALLPDATGPEIADRPGPVEDPGAPEGPAVPAPGAVEPGPLLVATDRLLRVLDADGTTRHAYELPEEGESTVTGLSVRPGSTVAEVTAAVLTTAEGMYDLRVLRSEGDGLTLQVVDEPPYRPGQDAGAGLVVSGPVWAPDGTSLAWLEQDETGTRLRTIGWDDGPGTGLPATDHATFDLAGAPPERLDLTDWVAVEPGRTLVRATSRTAGDRWFELAVTRAADGAWSLAPGATLDPVGAPPSDDGPVRALAGTVADGATVTPAWLVRVSDEGPVAVRASTGESRPIALPGVLLGPDGDLVPAWAAEVEGGLIVGNRRTASAVVVGEGGDVREFPDPVAHLSPIR
ncbi:MAG: hypothetical protein EA340_02240 [Nitriliruptor sp.]|nr:MAG: hypothetical protein EA340_02240 [Nitriliruptor sp.]